MLNADLSLDLQTLSAGYLAGSFSPRDVLALIRDRIRRHEDRHIWIRLLSAGELEPYLQRLETQAPERLPLYGIPFAIKDNIDLAGIPTTAGCAEYAYTPDRHAFVVQRLIQAGAIPVGKTNLDQFATGLVGTRSPYGACENAFDPDYIAGGSSSGSAVAVALGLTSFSLGTDTAGSGRVPAAFNNLVGVKPTRGLLSTSGIVPACRSLDCASIFALCSQDAQQLLGIAEGFDPADGYARKAPLVRPGFDVEGFRFGVPREDQLEFFGNTDACDLFEASVAALQRLGGEQVEIDFDPFLQAARLLYEGPWVAERYAAIEDFIRERPQALFPVTRRIIEAGGEPKAVDAFKAQYRLMDCRRRSEAAWEQVDVMVTPTAGTLYTLAEVDADPVNLNSNLGYYTNFMNLLDLAACAVPAGFQSNGLPFGVTLIGPAFSDSSLGALAARLHARVDEPMGATRHPLPAHGGDDAAAAGNEGMEQRVSIAVCGAHMRGLPLNHQLTEVGGLYEETMRTSADYRFYALSGGPPYRPGLVRSTEGVQIEVELWSLPVAAYGAFITGIPAPLGIGRVELEDGREVQGFVCEAYAIEAAKDISSFGGWRQYLATQEASAQHAP